MATAAGLPRQRVEEVLDLVELTGHASRRVGDYSMGMLQRLALLGDPGVLILDEPVNGLDPPGILWVRDLLRRLAGEGRALLVSSHLLAGLAEVAHRVVVIDRGRVVADMSLDDLLAGRSRLVELRCADPGRMVRAVTAREHPVDLDGDLLVIRGITAREAGEIVAAAGAGPVYWLAERANSFEDVYFELAGSMAGPPVTVAARPPSTAIDGRVAS